MINAKHLPWVQLLQEVAPPHRDLMETFHLFIGMAACAVACGTREDEYHRLIRGWTQEELRLLANVFGQLVQDMQAANYGDVLGPAYEAFEGRGNKRRTGSFYTPPSLTDLIAHLQASRTNWPQRGPLTIHEPAGGSGGMLLALVRELRERGAPPQSVRIQTWDVNRTACNMAFINLTLHGIPAEIVWGDTLRLEVSGAWRTLWYHATHGWPEGRSKPTFPPQASPPPDFGLLFAPAQPIGGTP